VYEIASQNTHADLDQGYGNADPNRDHRRDQGQAHPERST
jgi:hypothetical protein